MHKSVFQLQPDGLPEQIPAQRCRRGFRRFFCSRQRRLRRWRDAFPDEKHVHHPGHDAGAYNAQFLPNKEGQKVVKILHDGQDIMKSGIDNQTRPGDQGRHNRDWNAVADCSVSSVGGQQFGDGDAACRAAVNHQRHFGRDGVIGVLPVVGRLAGAGGVGVDFDPPLRQIQNPTEMALTLTLSRRERGLLGKALFPPLAPKTGGARGARRLASVDTPPQV